MNHKASKMTSDKQGRTITSVLEDLIKAGTETKSDEEHPKQDDIAQISDKLDRLEEKIRWWFPDLQEELKNGIRSDCALVFQYKPEKGAKTKAACWGLPAAIAMRGKK